MKPTCYRVFALKNRFRWQNSCRIMKKINVYIWCSKDQLRQFIDFFDDKGCYITLLSWHKTDVMPAVNNIYLCDTEYCIFAKEKGVALYGNYKTKHRYYVTPSIRKEKSYGDIRQ